MCAAILSAYGEKFGVDAFLANSPFRQQAEVWHAGEKNSGDSGFQIIIRDERELKLQIESCIGFIRQHLVELKRLRECDGVTAMDFRIAFFWHEGVGALAYTLPQEVHVALAHA